MDVFTFHDPDADAFHATGIYIPGVFNRHGRIGGMEAAGVFMIEALFAADKYFPERPRMFWLSRVVLRGLTAFVSGNIAVKIGLPGK
jgi:hypothetical protein